MENLENKIFEKLIETMDIQRDEIEGFTYDSPIFNSGSDDQVTMGLDSVDALELVVMIYDQWGIDVPSEDMKLLGTVNKIADYVRTHGE